MSIGAGDDEGREKLCRYAARPAISLHRLRRLRGGLVAYHLKYVRGPRGKHRIMDPMECLARLAALVPPPRYPLVRYAGVLGPRSAWRKEIVPRPRQARVPCAPQPPREGSREARGGSACTVCGVTTPDSSGMVYSKAGDLICPGCHTVEEAADAQQRITDRRTHVIVGSASVVSALATLGAFVYAYHEKHYVYVENGHVLETSDASFEVLKIGIFLALVAAGVGGALANWLQGRLRRKA